MANFKQIADFDVARYRGVRSGLGKCADGLFRDFFVGHDNALPDERLHGAFDWDGEIIYVPCGYESAFNAWSSIGRFLKHVQSNHHDASRKVCFVRYCTGVVDGGIIFGNDRIIFSASVHTSTAVQKIFETKEGCTIDVHSLSVTADGTIVFKADYVLYILSRSGNAITGYVTQSIPLNSGINKIKLLEHRLDSDFSYVAACEARKSAAKLGEPAKLWLVSLKSSSVINRLEMESILDFSRHPYKPELVVLGQNKLTLLSLPDLKTVRSVALPFAGGNPDPVCANAVYSPNGQYFALTYAGNGDVEIRGAGTLETVYTLNGRGFPLVDMAWDSTGNYLACRFAVPFDPVKFELTVFDIRSQEIVFDITINHQKETAEKSPETVFRWSPRATELACLIDNQRIRIYKPA